MFRIPFTKDGIPYIKCVAYRDGYSVTFKTEFDENDEPVARFVEIGADEEAREEFLEDVECERQSASCGGTPVYSLRTVSCPEKLSRLMRLNQTSAFIILKKDEEAFFFLLYGSINY